MGMNYDRVRRGFNTAVIQSRQIDRAAAHGSHSEGWPHLGYRGNCLCTKRCCLNGGCCCPQCNHITHRWALARP